MTKIKLALKDNDITTFEKECKFQPYLSDKEISNILKTTVKENKLDFFKIMMKNYLNPTVFWDMNKIFIKNNQYDFLKIMITLSRDSEKETSKKNFYVDQLLFDFIERDDLYFVDYLITKEKASTKNIPENEVTILNECIKNNAIKCFDYFLSKGKNVHDLNDMALFTALDTKKYDMLGMIINVAQSIHPQIEENFYKYGQNKSQKDISNKELLLLMKISTPFLEKSDVLQNGLNYQLIKRGLFKELEENLKKGFSPIGEGNYNLMDLTVTLKKDKIKMIKLLLDYGSIITDTHKKELTILEENEIEIYPRFSKVRENLEKKLPYKGKGNINKI